MSRTKNEIVRREFLVQDGLHIREVDGAESRIIEGYAIVFNAPSVNFWDDEEGVGREIISPEAVTMELLDSSDIKMTMYHNREKILARSTNGKGTLSYVIDEKGVLFSFEAPKTALGDEALELVRRGDIAGCSFAFSTRYYDPDCVEHKVERVGNRTFETYIVRVITGLYDFTLAADPAYPSTSVEAREFTEALREKEEETVQEEVEKPNEKIREQVAEMRLAAARRIQ